MDKRHSTERHSTERHSIEGTMMVLGAAGLGMGLMFLLDPQQGRRRREALKSTAGHVLSSTGAVIGTTIHGASDSARSIGQKVGDYAHHLTENLSDSAHEAIESGQRAGHSHLAEARRRVHEAKQRWTERAESLWSRPQSHPATLATGITAATVGLLGLGAGLMYVLDPSKGRARRAWIRDKALSITRHTGREARHLGQHLGNRMKGGVAQARRSAPWREDQASMPQSVSSSQP